MANRGTFQGKELMTEDAWNQLHAEPKLGSLGGCGVENTVSLTKGGIWKYGYHLNNTGTLYDSEINKNRNGFWGGTGYNGSIF